MTWRSTAVVCLRRQNVTAGYWRRHQLIALDNFEHSEAGHDDFIRWLARIGHANCHFLLDTPDEALKLEILPHVPGPSRNAMVARKLDQFQPGHPYKAAVRMGRETTGRRDDRYLFLALTQEALLHPWLDIVNRSQHPLAGIALMPVLCHRLARILRLNTENLLLVTRHRHSLRQSHIVNGALRLSRIVTSPDASPRHLAGETEKALLYLMNARTAGGEAPLHAVFAGVDDTGLADTLDSQHETTWQAISPERIAQRFGLESDRLSREPDVLFMALVAHHSGSGNLAQPQELSRLRSQRLQRGINLASAALLASTTVAASLHASTALHLQQEAQALSNQIRSLPPHPATPSDPHPPSAKEVHSAVELATRIEHGYRAPLELMQIISGALDELPEIQLDKLDWQLGESSMPVPTPNAPQFAVIEGKIHSRDTALLKTLISHLKAHPAIATVDNQQPAEPMPLRGTTQNSDSLTPQPFRLRIGFNEDTL